jgi:hypothetical protein
VCRWPVASLSPALSRFALGSKTIAGMVVKYRHPAARDDLSPRLRLVRPGVRDLPSARRPRAGAGQAVRRLRKVAIATEAGREITMAPRTPHNLVAALASYRSTRARGTAATSSVARQLDGRRPDHRRGRAPRLPAFAQPHCRGRVARAVLRASDVVIGGLRGCADPLAGGADCGVGHGETW